MPTRWAQAMRSMDLTHRQGDDTHHGMQTRLLHFFPKNLDNLLKLAVGQGVSFARRSHQIDVLKPVTNDVAEMLTKLEFIQSEVFPPRQQRCAQEDLRKSSWHGIVGWVS